MDQPAGSKVLGLEPEAYVRISYILILVAAGLALLMSLLAFVGAFVGIPLIGLVGLVGWLMAVIGWAGFPQQFSGTQMSHLRYIAVIFIALFILGMILSAALFGTGVIWMVVSLCMSVLQLAMFYAGYSLWKSGREATKESIKSELGSLKSKITKRGSV